MTHDYVHGIEREAITLVREIDRDPLLGSVVRGDASRDEYVEFLSGTYHYIRWSGALLAETAAGLRRSGRYPWLVELVDKKTAEESPHDAWVLNDLARCGEDVALVKASAAPVAVALYVHLSMTMADAGSPAFLGAAYALEYISMSRASMAAENLRARRAIPKIEEAVTFLEGHGDADPGHIEELTGVLRRIEDPRDQAAILRSAATLRALYLRFFQCDGRRRPSSARPDAPLGSRALAA